MIRQLEEREKRALRRFKGIKKPHDRAIVNGGDVSTVKKTREFYAPLKPGFVPAKPRGRSHVVMGETARAALADRRARRLAFLDAITRGV